MEESVFVSVPGLHLNTRSQTRVPYLGDGKYLRLIVREEVHAYTDEEGRDKSRVGVLSYLRDTRVVNEENRNSSRK